jgi:hypothetical protein
MIIQSPDEVFAFRKAQHDLIEDMFDEVLHASDPQARDKPFIELRWLPAVHTVVHPGVRHELDADDASIDAPLKEEHEANSQQFIDELTNLRDAVLEHSKLTTSTGWAQRCERLRRSHQPVRMSADD